MREVRIGDVRSSGTMKQTGRLNTGDRLDGYTVEEPLASGGQATIYRVGTPYGDRALLKLARGSAPDPLAGGTMNVGFAVALQFQTGVVGPSWLTPNQVLQAEIAVLKAGKDSALPGVVSTGTLVDRTYVMLEEVPGKTLRACMDDREPPPFEWFMRLGETLSRLQKSGRLPYHGDLKPENVIVTPAGGAVLIDPTSGIPPEHGRVTTPRYYPLLTPDDRPAFALMLIEAMTGVALIQEDPPYPVQAVTPVFDAWMAGLRALGRERFARALRHIPRLEDMSLFLSADLGRVLLRALYLRRGQGGLLGVDPGYPGWEDFLADLRAAQEG